MWTRSMPGAQQRYLATPLESKLDSEDRSPELSMESECNSK